jgi:hypothetical protein
MVHHRTQQTACWLQFLPQHSCCLCLFQHVQHTLKETLEQVKTQLHLMLLAGLTCTRCSTGTT